MQIATVIAVYANWGFARIQGIGWGWAGVIWLYSIVFYFPLDIMKFAIRYILSGKAWNNLLENKVFAWFIHSYLFWNGEVSMNRFRICDCCMKINVGDRLPSPPRKTMVKRRGKLNGLLLRGPCMDFNHQKLLISSMKRAVIENWLRLLSRPREELKLQGKQPNFLASKIIMTIRWCKFSKMSNSC